MKLNLFDDDHDGHVSIWRERLVTENMRLIYGPVRKFLTITRRKDLKEDAECEALAALVRASRKFNASLGWKFSTFSVVAMNRAMMGMLKKYDRGDNMPGRTRVWDDENLLQTMPDHDTTEPGEAVYAVQALKKCFKVLTNNELDVVVQRHFGDDTLEVIAGRKGITKERVRQINKAALEKMRVVPC